MSEEHDTGELKAQQVAQVRHEREMAQIAADEEEVAQHRRRAEKADYLRAKLEERERSEREADG